MVQLGAANCYSVLLAGKRRPEKAFYLFLPIPRECRYDTALTIPHYIDSFNERQTGKKRHIPNTRLIFGKKKKGTNYIILYSGLQ